MPRRYRTNAAPVLAAWYRRRLYAAIPPDRQVGFSEIGVTVAEYRIKK